MAHSHSLYLAAAMRLLVSNDRERAPTPQQVHESIKLPTLYAMSLSRKVAVRVHHGVVGVAGVVVVGIAVVIFPNNWHSRTRFTSTSMAPNSARQNWHYGDFYFTSTDLPSLTLSLSLGRQRNAFN